MEFIRPLSIYPKAGRGVCRRDFGAFAPVKARCTCTQESVACAAKGFCKREKAKLNCPMHARFRSI